LLSLSPEEPEASDDDAPKVWDPARVCRHLERAIAQAYRALRRGSWLCLLANGDVRFREPGATGYGRITLQGAELVQLETTPKAVAQSRLATQLAFDAAHYDSLRILTTELKRILRDGGDVSVQLSPSRVLQGATLARLLRVV